MPSVPSSGDLWLRRVIATFVDFVPLALLAEALFALCGQRSLFGNGQTPGELVSRLIDLAAIAAYMPVVMKLTDGQTLGKMAMRIRVVCTDRRPMRVYRAAWREVVVKPLIAATFVSFTWLPPAIGAVGFIVAVLDGLWPLWDRENRALHDMLAATRVRGTAASVLHTDNVQHA